MTQVKRISKVLFYISLCFFMLVIMTFCAFNLNLFDSFTDVKFDKDKLTYTSSSVLITDNNGKKVNENVKKNINFEDIPNHTINAFISIEDKDFYNHHGINYKRIVKAGLKNIKNLKFSEGASTITQQLIKNTHLTSEKTIKRKFNEIVLAKNVEKQLDKNQIMTAYLNAIYFGNGTFGINEASQRYFSKDACNLNLQESATLAGIIKSPKLYSPITNKDNCLKRRNLVLKEMKDDNKISEEEYNLAKDSPLELNLNKNFLGYNDYYNAVIDEACHILKLNEKDLVIKKYKINTYLDPKLQNLAIEQINNLQEYTKCPCDGAILSIDNSNGGIKAYFGKSDYNLLNINLQPGSTIKPIIAYAPAIEYGLISPCTPILDEKISINNYTPHNYKNKYHGYISCKTALANSYNVPSVKILDYVGVQKAKSFAKKLNLELDENDNGLSIALGGLTKGVKLIDLTNCYCAFANNGRLCKAKFIKSIEDSSGNIIYKNIDIPKQVMKDSTAYLITDMLRESVKNGTCKKLNLSNLTIAGKTGTVGNSSNHLNTDAWSISYTKSQTLCVYIKNAKKDVNNSANNYLPSDITGSNAPSCIAQEIYKNSDLKNEKFDRPNSVLEVELNDIEYTKKHKILKANAKTPDRYKRKELFAISNLPKENSNMFEELPILTINCKKTNDKIEICFDAEKYLEYEIYCCSDDNTRLLKAIKNTQGKFVTYDNQIKSGNFYEYYVIEKYNGKTIKSNTVKFYIS